MTVFNAYLTIFKRKWKSLIIYLVIFVVFGNMSARANADTMKKSFESRSLNVSIIDNDKSELSKAVTKYIKSGDKIKNLKTNDLKKINDYVRYGLVDYALIIPKGFQAGVDNNGPEIKYISGGTTSSEAIMTRKINTYINDVKAYNKSGSTITESIDKTRIAVAEASDSKVRLVSTEVKHDKDLLYHLFNFAAYGMYMLISESIGMVLVRIKEKDVRTRINISSYSYLKKNMEIILGILISSILGVSVFAGYSALTGTASQEYGKILFYCLNLFITMLPGMSIGYFIGSISEEDNIINLIANSLILTMSFISGVFVSRDILSAGVLRFARFSPMYWYVEGNGVINDNPIGNILGSDFMVCAIMQLLFAVVIMVAGLIINRIRERARIE
jgi:ABC-2 type transport system permease protein